MTVDERALALYDRYLKLDEHSTADEIDIYPLLAHLGDLIQDLEDD